jgi:hypothetical protein
MALFRDGKLLHVIHRSEIGRWERAEIAELFTTTFDRFCSTPS